MNPSSLDISGHELLEKLHEGPHSLVYRAIHRATAQPVVLKISRGQHPTTEQLTRLNHELALLRSVDSDHVIKGLGLENRQRHQALVLEDFGATHSLRQLLRQNAQRYRRPEEFLKLTVPLCLGLEALHGAGIIHKRLNPGNVVANPANGTLKIIDCASAVRTTTERAATLRASLWDDHLPYISPEQTGRSSAVLDTRTDLYSLGVMMFELLAGAVPFQAETSLELLACHLAVQPPPLDDDIPEVLRQIVTRLLSKIPEDRYQSAWGVRADLERCSQDDAAATFRLGQRDIPDTLRVSGKLYGRESQAQILESSWRRVIGGPNREVVLIGGYSGIGKTSLVRGVHTTVTVANGHLVWGKNEQYLRHTPHAALVYALSQLVRQWLTEDEERSQARKARLEEALGPHGRIITTSIPDLAILLPDPGPLPEVDAQESQHRFERTWVRFLQCCCSAEEPLALFLDDLQWADPASLRLLELVLSDQQVGPLLLIGAYRDNEVDEFHALSTVEWGCPITRIELPALRLPSIVELLVDTLHRPEGEVLPLAELLEQKTAGNPLFVNQFLRSLQSEGLLTFDAQNLAWRWSLDQILQRKSTDNVADLMMGNAKKLPPFSQRLLSLAACVGVRFQVGLLAAVMDCEPDIVTQNLQLLSREGMITREPEAPGTYRFCHDRVQQAAQALCSDRESRQWRLLLARQLMTNRALPADQLFVVVEHFDHARDLLVDAEERELVAALCLQAAEHAKKATSYQSAHAYLDLGLAMDTASSRELHLTLRLEMAEIELLLGNVEACEQLILETLPLLSGGTIESIAFHRLLIRRHTVAAQYDEALAVGRTALKLLGVDLPGADAAEESDRLVAWIREKLKDGPEFILDLPELQAVEQRLTVQLLDLLIPATYQSGQWDLFTWVYVKAVRLCLEFGNVPEVGFCYSWYGNMLNFRFGEYRAALQMGQTALRLMKKFGHGSQQSKVYLSMAVAQGPWVESFETLQGWLDDCYRVGSECGELHFAGFAIKQQFFHDLHRGRNLDELLAFYDQVSPFLRSTRNQLALDVAETTRLLVLQLISGQLDSQAEEQLLDDCREHQSRMAICCYQIFRAQALYHYGDFVAARRSLNEARELLYTIVLFAHTATFNFLDSLLIIREDGDLDQVTKNQAQLGAWADSCPDNFRHKHLLVEAELAAMRWDRLRALELYEQAIALARSGGFLHDEALACELASAFYRNWGKETLSHSYLGEAYHAYRRWGATAKLAELEADSPGLAQEPARREASESLDFNAALRASQVLSGEMDLQRLLTYLMKLVMDCSGARRGVLLLRDDSGLIVEGEAFADPEQIQVLQSRPVSSDMVPQLVINFTLRTGQDILLADAWRDGDFRRDPYIGHHQSKSVLCLPLSQQGKVGGVLYLENSLAVSAFTEDQVRVLRLLAAQAAISIVNARLYANLEEKVKERTRAAELAQQAAEAASLAKSTFLASMSHEIRTPLNAILGYSQILRSAPELSSRSRDGLEVIESNGRHLLELIDEVLDLAKIEAGKMELRLSDFDLRTLLSGLSRTFALRCQEKGLNWRLEAPAELPRVHGDEQKVRQVLLNLLGNAVKFTRAGEVGLRVWESEGGYAFEVSDTGPGIAPEERELIMEPFGQGTTSTGDTAGTGLGLSITVRQIDLMKGRLQLDSQLGQGSRFSLWLPLLASDSAQPQDQPIIGFAQRLAPQQSCFALVVDDVTDSRNLLSTVLQQIGCRVLEAMDGAEAVRLTLEHRPDIVWMDIRMPVLDGPSAARHIWDALGSSAPKIVAVSASAFGHDREEFLQFGFDAFMAKPYPIEEVGYWLATLLPLSLQSAALPDAEKKRLSLRIVAQLRTAVELEDPVELADLLRQVHEHGAEADVVVAENMERLLPTANYDAMRAILEAWEP